MDTFYLGIVGHRDLGHQDAVAFVTRECGAILRQMLAQHKELIAISALAEGADTLFSEAALELGIPLEIVRPFAQFATDFPTPAAKERYCGLQAAARRETRLAYLERSVEAYRDAMIWVLDRSDVVILVWNGRPGKGVGGTGDAAGRLMLRNQTWIHVDSAQYSVTCHPARSDR